MLEFSWVILLHLLYGATAQRCPAGSLPANQIVQWTPCPINTYAPSEAGIEIPYYFPTLECSTIDVPLDYTNGGSNVLTIPLVRIPSNSSTPLNKTIIYNPGGPGSSAIEGLLGSAESLTSIAGNDYNLLAFDPRGVGLTSVSGAGPYACPQHEVEIDSLAVPITYFDGLNAVHTDHVLQGEICAQQQYLAEGELVGTAFVARDINAIAEALGEDGFIRYWGFSYGTALGSTVAAMYPDKIDRMVLDGNWNPTQYYHGYKDENVDDTDRALFNFFQNCADAGPDFCPITGTTTNGQLATAEQLQETFYGVLYSLWNGTYYVDSSIRLSNNNTFDYKPLKSEIFGWLYSPVQFSSIAQEISNLYNYAQVSTDLAKRQSTDFNVTEWFGYTAPNIFQGIECGDWSVVRNASLEDYETMLSVYQNRSEFGGDQFVDHAFLCSTWKINAKEVYSGSFTGIETRTPILFVNSDLDPVTPLVSAQNSSSGFIGSAVLQHAGAGHCSTAHPSNCVQEKVRSYWDTGVLPDVSEICQPNVANPFLEDIRNPINITDATFYNTTSDSDQRQLDFNKAVANFGVYEYASVKRNVPFEFPKALLQPQRIERLSIRQEDISNTAECTPMVAITPSPIAGAKGTASSGTSSGDSESGASKDFGNLVLRLMLAFVVPLLL